MMFKSKMLLVVAGCLMLTGLTGCQTQKDAGPDYADDEAMEIIAESVMARADLVDKYEEEGVDTVSMKSLQSYIDAERRGACEQAENPRVRGQRDARTFSPT